MLTEAQPVAPLPMVSLPITEQLIAAQSIPAPGIEPIPAAMPANTPQAAVTANSAQAVVMPAAAGVSGQVALTANGNVEEAVLPHQALSQ